MNSKRIETRTDQVPWKLIFLVVTPAAVMLAVFATYVLRPQMTEQAKARLAAAEEIAQRSTAAQDALEQRAAEIETALARSQEGETLADERAYKAEQEVIRLRAELAEAVEAEKTAQHTAEQRAKAVKALKEELYRKPGVAERPQERATPSASRPDPAEEVAVRAEDLGHRIAQKQDVSYFGRSRMVYRVAMEADAPPTNESVKRVALSIWQQYGKEYDEFTVFCYLKDMNTSGAAYATAEFRRNGLKEFNVNEFLRAGTQSAASVPRLSETVRKRVFADLGAAAHRADAEAYRMFPDQVEKQVEKWGELLEKYKAAARKKHGITREEQQAIIIEGLKKGW